MNDGETILWRRIDLPGHEVATASREADGWLVVGVAVFAHDGMPCRLTYEIRCDGTWATRACVVGGELPVGAAASVRAAWVRFPEFTVELLEQSYTRIASDRYHYESAGGAFHRDLTVDAFGCVTEYPGLWTAEATTRHGAPVA